MFSVKLQDAVVNVPLPKGAGETQVNLATLPESIIAQLIYHGAKQKRGDLAVDFYLKKDRPNPKEGDKVFDTLEELRAAVRKRAAELDARWAQGEWNLDGSGTRSDPVQGEVWSILYTNLDIPTKDRAKARELGERELALRLYEAQTKSKRPSGKDKQDATAKLVLDQVRTTAQAIVASRGLKLNIEI